MRTTIDRQPKSQLKLLIEVSVEEMKPHLEKAAESLSRQHKIEGFWPGKASLGIVAQKLGVQAVWEAAAEEAIRKSYVAAVRDHQLKSIGQPHVHVQKLAPDNPFVFTAVTSILPDIEIGEYTTFKAVKKPVMVTPAQVDQALDDLRAVFAAEALVDRAAAMGDKVEVDFDLLVNNVPLENGSSKQHPIKLGSNHFIPGFEEQLVGLKKGDRKEFTLPFPDKYHNKQIAGKAGTFKVTMQSVFDVKTPALDDEFAKRAGKFQTLVELRAQIEKNLLTEGEQKEDTVWENALIDELIGRSKFGDLPDLLVDSEISKMLGEYREQIEQSGGKFEDYLQGIQKTIDGLKQEFRRPAERRVKAALLIRHIAESEKIGVPSEEVEKEVQSTLKIYQGQPDILQRIDSQDYRDYIRSMLINKKVIGLLKRQASHS